MIFSMAAVAQAEPSTRSSYVPLDQGPLQTSWKQIDLQVPDSI
jgi:hypothetical protein